MGLYLAETNSGCPIGKVAFPKDNDPSQILVRTMPYPVKLRLRHLNHFPN